MHGVIIIIIKGIHHCHVAYHIELTVRDNFFIILYHSSRVPCFCHGRLLLWHWQDWRKQMEMSGKKQMVKTDVYLQTAHSCQPTHSSSAELDYSYNYKLPNYSGSYDYRQGGWGVMQLLDSKTIKQHPLIPCPTSHHLSHLSKHTQQLVHALIYCISYIVCSLRDCMRMSAV